MKRIAFVVAACVVLASCSVLERPDDDVDLSADADHQNATVASEVSGISSVRSPSPVSNDVSNEFRKSIPPSPLFAELRSLDGAMTTVTLHFRQVPISVFAKVLSRVSGLNITVAKNAQSRQITLYLDEVVLYEALHAAAYAYQLRIEIKGNVVFLDNQPAGAKKGAGASLWRPEYTELFYPDHSMPEDMKTALEPLFGGSLNKPTFSVDARTRALIVKGSREQVAMIGALLEHLDTPVRQVLIEAFIVEASEDFERSFGTRFKVNSEDSDGLRLVGTIGDKASGGSDQGQSGNDGTAVDLAVPAPNFGVGLLLDSNRLRIELTALEAEGKSRIVSNPRVFTLDKQEAVIFQGEEVPYLSVSDGGTRTEFKQAGLRLAVTPVITRNNQLQLNIAVNKDTVDTRILNPPITRREVTTSLKVADGAVVVIGGIYLNAEVDTARRVPLLGSLPLVGGLFRQTFKDRDAKQLLIFIAPKIVGP